MIGQPPFPVGQRLKTAPKQVGGKPKRGCATKSERPSSSTNIFPQGPHSQAQVLVPPLPSSTTYQQGEEQGLTSAAAAEPSQQPPLSKKATSITDYAVSSSAAHKYKYGRKKASMESNLLPGSASGKHGMNSALNLDL